MGSEALITSPDPAFVDEFLAYLERRRDEAQRRFDDLTRRRRASMSPSERSLAHRALRREAGELWRVKLAISVTRALKGG